MDEKLSKETKTVMGVFIEPSIIEQIREAAKGQKRSLSAQVAWILQEWLERRNDGKSEKK